MKCSKCGNEFEGKFCPNCGAPATPPSDAPASPTPAQFGNQKSIPPKKKLPLWVVFTIIIGIVFLIFISSSEAGTALGISAGLGVLMFAVSLIVSVIRKQRKKSNLTGLIICLGLVIIASNVLPSNSNVPVSAASNAPSSDKNVSLTSEEQKAYDKIKEEVDSEEAASNESASMVVDYKTLYKEYMDNPINADSKYKGKQITISGNISRIDREIDQKPYIIFEVSPGEEIRMDFSRDSEKEITELKKGQKVKVSGTCKGTLMSIDIMLDDCSVIG